MTVSHAAAFLTADALEFAYGAWIVLSEMARGLLLCAPVVLLVLLVLWDAMTPTPEQRAKQWTVEKSDPARHRKGWE